MKRWLDTLWKALRELSGDAAYERYLATLPPQCTHPPLSRREFYARRERDKWTGVKRCC